MLLSIVIKPAEKPLKHSSADEIWILFIFHLWPKGFQKHILIFCLAVKQYYLELYDQTHIIKNIIFIAVQFLPATRNIYTLLHLTWADSLNQSVPSKYILQMWYQLLGLTIQMMYESKCQHLDGECFQCNESFV